MFLQASAIPLRGSDVTCPCCERTFKRFVDLGLGSQCPGCGALMRHRLLGLHLARRVSDTRGRLRVLHVAPERGVRLVLEKAKSLDYVSTDLRSPLASVRADLTQLPFESDAFGLEICCHVLEHVLDDRRAIAELYRTLRPAGTAIVQVPINAPFTEEDATVTDPVERARRFGQYDHVRVCGLDYRLRLEQAGFVVETVDLAEDLGSDDRRRFGVTAGEVFFFCTKPADSAGSDMPAPQLGNAAIQRLEAKRRPGP